MRQWHGLWKRRSLRISGGSHCFFITHPGYQMHRLTRCASYHGRRAEAPQGCSAIMKFAVEPRCVPGRAAHCLSIMLPAFILPIMTQPPTQPARQQHAGASRRQQNTMACWFFLSATVRSPDGSNQKPRNPYTSARSPALRISAGTNSMRSMFSQSRFNCASRLIVFRLGEMPCALMRANVARASG